MKMKLSVLVPTEEGRDSASVGVPKRLCVISAHFRVHSNKTHLPCDRTR